MLTECQVIERKEVAMYLERKITELFTYQIMTTDPKKIPSLVQEYCSNLSYYKGLSDAYSDILFDMRRASHELYKKEMQERESK